MISVITRQEQRGVTLHVVERRRDKWRRASVKIEPYYSRKRLAAIFRKMAQLIELGFPGDTNVQHKNR